MNILRAKQEIIRTVQAYLAKDEDGQYLIPSVHQRPILLMGPPGTGKAKPLSWSRLPAHAASAWFRIPSRITPARAPSVSPI